MGFNRSSKELTIALGWNSTLESGKTYIVDEEGIIRELTLFTKDGPWHKFYDKDWNIFTIHTTSMVIKGEKVQT